MASKLLWDGEKWYRVEESQPLVNQPCEWLPSDDSNDEFEESEDDFRQVETLSQWQLPNWRDWARNKAG